MARTKVGHDGARTGRRARTATKALTVADVMKSRQREVLETWLRNIRALAGTRTLELMTEEQIRKQTTDLLRALTTAFGSEQYVDVDRPEFADSVSILRHISATRAERGFTASETATFIFSLKDALLDYLQIEFGDDPQLLNAEVIKMNKVIDKLGLVTFETFAQTREEVVSQQSRSLVELSTPVVKLWDEIVLVPLIGLIDTPRAQQLIETMLLAIVENEARVVVLDVTGVPSVDTAVGRHLIKTVAAAKMLGAEVIVTGISPDAAQTLVKLGIDLSGMSTAGSLRAGVAQGFAMIGKQVTSRSEEKRG